LHDCHGSLLDKSEMQPSLFMGVNQEGCFAVSSQKALADPANFANLFSLAQQ
jgi:hypothetical protein